MQPWRFMKLHLCMLFALALTAGCGGGGVGGGGAGAGPAPDNLKPIANAGPDRSVKTGSAARLDGSASTDDDGGPLAFNWTVVSRPSGSTADLSSPMDVTPSMVPDRAGVYTVALVVNDGLHESLPDIATISSTTAAAITVTSNLPDTGSSQYLCYDGYGEVVCPDPGDAIFGQDHQYVSNPVDYVDRGDGTVTDRVTGLLWQAGDSGAAYNWFEAAGVHDAVKNPQSVDICGSLSLAGRTDWRLPTMPELLSVMDYGRTMPAVDWAYFGGTAQAYYWSASAQPEGLNLLGAWRVDLGEGRAGVFRKGDWQALVRCVSGLRWGGGAFTDNLDGTVTDASTALMWTGSEALGLTWTESLGYCESLAYAGHTDWRLPDIKELQSLIDTARFMPVIDETYFASSVTGGSGALTWAYWSSTTYAGPAQGLAWTVSFDTGGVDYAVKSAGSYRARCVR